MLEPEAVDGADLLKNINEEKRDIDTHSGSPIIDKFNTLLHSDGGKNRLFGRQKPIHHVLGGGNSADIILWRKKQISAGIFAGGTVIWLMFECIGYRLIPLICHSFILLLSTLFLWSNLAAFNGMSPPKFPEIKVQEDQLVRVGLLLRNEFNRAYKSFHHVASRQDLKTFLSATMILWILSVVGNWFSFLTLLYLVFVMLLTLPMLYEKHEDNVDTFAERAFAELKKQYAILDEKLLHKLPLPSFQKQHRS